MSQRPVYVPQANRKRPRFHGAFTGGFSAGYFNTVGSKEGWAPGTIEEDQKPEDFMDEQDHNEWGGPTAARQDFQQENKDTGVFSVAAPKNVGLRLLRKLGYREGSSSAYVQDHFAGFHHVDEQQVLSKKRLRKVQLQQERVSIPEPKLDLSGLGYEPFQDAPEFRAFQERRRKTAQQRAKASQNVYRVADVLGADVEDEEAGHSKRTVGRAKDSDDGPYISYETVEDFVGSKSVGGFALREDEDDAYDDEQVAPGLVRGRINTDAYDVVAYDHNSDEEDIIRRGGANSGSFEGLLSSWIQGSGTQSGDQEDRNVGNALHGFASGVASLPAQVVRYPGPDLPHNYETKWHTFAPDDNPLVLKALSHAIRLEAIDERRDNVTESALRSNAAANVSTRSGGPRAESVFAGLSGAMRDRFTSSTSADPTPDNATASNPSESETRKILVHLKRTTTRFAPEPLLCKRFQVPVSSQTLPTQDGSRAKSKADEYFDKEVLARVQPIRPAASNSPSAAATEPSSVESMFQVDESNPKPVQARPPMATYKSIFGTWSDNSGGSDEEEGSTTRNQDHDVLQDDRPALALVETRIVKYEQQGHVVPDDQPGTRSSSESSSDREG